MWIIVLLALVLLAFTVLIFSIYFQFSRMEGKIEQVVEQVEVHLLHVFGEISPDQGIVENDSSILNEENDELRELQQNP
tara:strand:- start:382 stop:618 length:237 start_codon:yes stop_codon:yes gene_type:complete